MQYVRSLVDVVLAALLAALLAIYWLPADAVAQHNERANCMPVVD